LIALMQTPHRFRSKRQLWTYSGLGIETHDSAQCCYVNGQLQRSKKPQQIRGLNQNHEMKEIFKGAATRASCEAVPLRDFYVALLDKGMKPEMARHVRPEDRGHCFDALEKGGTLRRRRTEIASRLSVAQNSKGTSGFHA
jgi:hypothetical protein